MSTGYVLRGDSIVFICLRVQASAVPPSPYKRFSKGLGFRVSGLGSRGSNKGSNKGSNQGSNQGSNKGSNKGSYKNHYQPNPGIQTQHGCTSFQYVSHFEKGMDKRGAKWLRTQQEHACQYLPVGQTICRLSP